jgi:hypothetical protein
VVEDWGTGYWATWFDGSQFETHLPDLEAQGANRLKSHDYGMVGFVKSLVDLTHETAIKTNQSDPSLYKSRLSSLEVRESVCFARKAPVQSGQVSHATEYRLAPPLERKRHSFRRRLKTALHALKDLA